MKSRAVGILVMVLVVIVAVFCITGFKGKPKEVYLEDMQGETLPDGSTRYDLGNGDFVIEPGNWEITKPEWFAKHFLRFERRWPIYFIHLSQFKRRKWLRHYFWLHLYVTRWCGWFCDRGQRNDLGDSEWYDGTTLFSKGLGKHEKHPDLDWCWKKLSIYVMAALNETDILNIAESVSLVKMTKEWIIWKDVSFAIFFLLQSGSSCYAMLASMDIFSSSGESV